MNAELVYSVKDIFQKCLNDYNADRYLIAPYQRGYKWSSMKNGQVPILLNDLREAFVNDKDKEYFLQYITVKKKDRMLEVIDGQQRLTTLSILLSVFKALGVKENISLGKLQYSVRQNFLEKSIYSLTDNDIAALKVTDNNNVKRQDEFYMLEAAKFFANNLNKDDGSFYEFIIKHVKIIVNAVESHVVSEKVFANLNSNKVALTDCELIKALLLTRTGREIAEQTDKRNFREISGIRASMGRQWDEMSRWVNDKKKSQFFFNKLEGMESLLTLVALQFNYKPLERIEKKDHVLFNFYHSANDGGKRIFYSSFFEKTKLVYHILRDWYESDELYNLIGYLFHAKGLNTHRINFLATHLTLSKQDFKKSLLKKKDAILNSLNVETLNYDKSPDQIHQVLLAMSIFNSTKEMKIVRFDFFSFMEEKWTLEHIFPQSPEGKGNVLNEGEKNTIRDILGDTLTNEMEYLLSKLKREQGEKELYYRAIKESGLLNSIGNMALLRNNDNIKIGCKWFREKRNIIQECIQSGSFVPGHTFNVFSKMILIAPDNLDGWTKTDILEHKTAISNFINQSN